MSAQAWLPPRKCSLDSTPRVLILMYNWGWVFHPAQIEILRRIRGVFDPHRILNPGKIFP